MSTLIKHFSLWFCMLFMLSCKSNEDKKEQSTVPSFSVEGFIVKAQSFNSEVTTTANLLANEQVELKAPISAQVLTISFKEGQNIQKGSPIIRMDDRIWKAQLKALKAELEIANKTLERRKSLLEIEGSSQEEVDEITSKIESITAQIQQLQLNIELANVTAPFAGKLGMRNFSEGAYLKEGETITQLTAINPLKIDFYLAQDHIQSLEIGKEILLLVEEDTFSAKIYAVNPIVNQESRTINVRALLSQSSQHIILPGTYAEVLITTNFIENALLVPTQAIVPEINDQTIFIYKNGKAQRKTVQLGNRTADKVHITGGISDGDTIITTGLLRVKEGMNVQLQSLN